MENNDLEQPRIVSSHDIHIDKEYANWIAEVKHHYRSAQVKAALKVNAEKLLFNWQLGRDLVQKKAEERWGAGVVEQISIDLKKEFPEDDGFSTRNLWYMKKWYVFYVQENELSFLHQLGAEMQNTESQYLIKMHQLGAELGDEKLYQVGRLAIARAAERADGIAAKGTPRNQTFNESYRKPIKTQKYVQRTS